ncbi:MAG TPA: hypothetical protein VLT62_01425 [Candidatus Methylomirabilis sp.]|nr:hypothetical protein [Candidatus Methylomirabilis sp.]
MRKSRGVASIEKGVLDRLTEDEAATVLRLLLEKRPELRKDVEAAAELVLGGVSAEEVADAVEDAVGSLDLDDLSSRAGRHRHGYVDPSQAAVDLVEEAVMPFIEDIKRRAEAGQVPAAMNTCLGVVLGLYRLRDKDGDEFLGWAVESPDVMAGEAIVTFRKALRAKPTARGGPQPPASLPAIFRETAPGWAEMLERTWRRPA